MKKAKTKQNKNILLRWLTKLLYIHTTPKLDKQWFYNYSETVSISSFV